MKTRKWVFGLLSVLMIATFVMMPVAMGAGKVVVYSPAPKNITDIIVDMWNKENPNIPVDMISAGTGELVTRLRTESVNPQADILFGGGTEEVDGILDLLQPYKSVNDAAYKKGFKHPKYYYYGYSMPLQVFIINTTQVSEKNAPQTWKQLGDTKWKGKLIMANPAVSASGYAQFSIMLQRYGWDLVKKVINNATISSSSKLSYQGVADGEYAVGITGEANVFNLIEQGYPVKAIYPKDGTALRYDTMSIIKNGPNPENAKKFMDFLTSKPVMTALAQQAGVRVCRGDVQLKAGLIPNSKIKFLKYDAKLAADQKSANLAKFDDIFSAKEN